MIPSSITGRGTGSIRPGAGAAARVTGGGAAGALIASCDGGPIATPAGVALRKLHPVGAGVCAGAAIDAALAK